MTHSWNDPETQDLWRLSTDESALLPGMTDKGRLGFAIQLKFMQLHGRFPERHDEIDPNATQWLAGQLGTTTEALSSSELTRIFHKTGRISLNPLIKLWLRQ